MYEFFQVREKGVISGRGEKVVVGSSTVKNLDCQIKVHTMRNKCRRYQIWVVKYESEDQQPLDPKESARGLNPLKVHKRVDLQSPKVLKLVKTIHCQG